MKKHMLISIFVLITHLVIGQDTIFLNDNYEEIKSFKEASFFKTIEKIDTDKIVERLYNTSGKCKSESEFKITKNDEKVLDGERKVYFDTGELRVLAYFTNGKKDGEFISYWKNGNLKRKDLYKKGKLKKGDCWDENGEKVKYYDFEIQPEYPGGNQKISQFIQKNLKYPELSKQYKIGGKVVVRFAIDTNGKVVDAHIKQSVNKEIDDEALRIINLMPDWKPGMQDGIPVKVKYQVPIVFNP